MIPAGILIFLAWMVGGMVAEVIAVLVVILLILGWAYHGRVSF